MALIEQAPPAPAVIPVMKIGKDGSMDNLTALHIVQKDVREAGTYMSQRQWLLRWKEIDALYQSPRPISMWEGTMTPESNVVSYMVAKHTNALVPAIMGSTFYQDPFFKLRPTPSMTEEMARMKETLFSSTFREGDLESTMWDLWFYTVLFGTGIVKFGVCETTKEKTTYKRKGRKASIKTKYTTTPLETAESKDMEATDKEEECWYPELTHIPNEQVLVDPSLGKPDIRKAKHVTHVMDMNGYDLLEYAKQHRDEEGYTIPSDDTIRSWFDTPVDPAGAVSTPEAQLEMSVVVTHAQPRMETYSGDPLMKPFKAWEHWTGKRVTL